MMVWQSGSQVAAARRLLVAGVERERRGRGARGRAEVGVGVHGAQVGVDELELDHERQVVRWHVRVWEPNDLVAFYPVRV